MDSCRPRCDAAHVFKKISGCEIMRGRKDRGASVHWVEGADRAASSTAPILTGRSTPTAFRS